MSLFFLVPRLLLLRLIAAQVRCDHSLMMFVDRLAIGLPFSVLWLVFTYSISLGSDGIEFPSNAFQTADHIYILHKVNSGLMNNKLKPFVESRDEAVVFKDEKIGDGVLSISLRRRSVEQYVQHHLQQYHDTEN